MLLLLSEPLGAGAASPGFVAVPVGAVPRPRSRSWRRAAAHEGRLDNMDFFYATEGAQTGAFSCACIVWR